MIDKREMFPVYIGWDGRETVAYKVCEHSLKRRTEQPLNVVALKHRELRESGFFRRPWLVESDTGKWRDLIDNKPFSTEFSHTRFLVPALQRYQGWALFMDCDMLWQEDIRYLLKEADPRYAVMVVKHNHIPHTVDKMDNQEQSRYYRKNWSSFVLWNCSHPSNKKLTAAMVSTVPGSELHGFAWLQDHEIGSLSTDWNWISGSSPVVHLGRPGVIHYTEGGPWFDNCQDVVYAEHWTEEYEHWQRNVSDYSELPSTRYE
jgi:lipopolysaccharide biosynthesis glycosyltransferase